MNSYTVKIQHFEGPFDLLLYFIERDELDIDNIPIAKITQDFLHYIQELERLNLDVASEFILVAATLMRIKAKMLIPRKEIDEDGNEIDPREELVARLLEYKRYKEVLGTLEHMAEDRELKLDRSFAKSERKLISETALIDVELESLDTYKLFKTFKTVLERYKYQQEQFSYQIIKYPYTIAGQRKYIIEQIKVKERVSFEEIFKGLENRMHCIVTFLSLLDLINSQIVMMTDSLQINSFWLEFKEGGMALLESLLETTETEEISDSL
jgi:segregation and condensation protein A